MDARRQGRGLVVVGSKPIITNPHQGTLVKKSIHVCGRIAGARLWRPIGFDAVSFLQGRIIIRPSKVFEFSDKLSQTNLSHHAKRKIFLVNHIRT
jgi:hypothetical protein